MSLGSRGRGSSQPPSLEEAVKSDQHGVQHGTVIMSSLHPINLGKCSAEMGCQIPVQQIYSMVLTSDTSYVADERNLSLTEQPLHWNLSDRPEASEDCRLAPSTILKPPLLAVSELFLFPWTLARGQSALSTSCHNSSYQ